MTQPRKNPGVSRNRTPGVWFSRQMSWPAGQGGGGCVVLQAGPAGQGGGGATQIHTIVLVLITPMWWCYTNTHHCVGTDHSNVVVLHKYTPLCWYWSLQCGGATQIHTTVLVLTTPMWWCYTNTHHCVGADHSNAIFLQPLQSPG